VNHFWRTARRLPIFAPMSTLAEIETAIRKLQPHELKALQDLIGEMLEDETDFTDEFKASMNRGWEDIEAGRVRKEDPGA
jgi:hypothetical protein